MATLNSPTLGKHQVSLVGLEIDPGEVEVSAEDITDATAVGVDLITAANAGAARTAIGAGTSSLALGTTSSTAKAGDYQPTWAQVTGKPAVIAAGADAAAARTAIGAGTSSLVLGSGGTQAAAGNHTHTGLMTGSATNVPDSAAADVETLVSNFNSLLTALAARGVITNT